MSAKSTYTNAYTRLLHLLLSIAFVCKRGCEGYASHHLRLLYHICNVPPSPRILPLSKPKPANKTSLVSLALYTRFKFDTAIMHNATATQHIYICIVFVALSMLLFRDHEVATQLNLYATHFIFKKKWHNKCIFIEYCISSG